MCGTCFGCGLILWKPIGAAATDLGSVVTRRYYMPCGRSKAPHIADDDFRVILCRLDEVATGLPSTKQQALQSQTK